MHIIPRFTRLTILSFTVLVFLATGSASVSIDDSIQKTFSVDSGGTLNIDTERGSIEIRGKSGNTVEIEVIRKVGTSDQKKAEKVLDNFKIEFKQTGKDVFVVGERAKKESIWDKIWNRLNIKFIVSVPEIYNVKLKTSGGSISVEDIEGEVNIKTSGGSLTLNDIRGPVWGKTSGGSIKIGEVDGHVDVNTSGGSIKAHISQQPESDCRLTTSGGSVTVYLTADIAVNVDAGTSGGSVHTEFPVTIKGKINKRELKAKINGGGPLLYLHTSGGSVYIKEM